MAKDHPTGESGLYSALLELKTPEECYRFLQDVCSYAELSAMEQRYNIAEKLVSKQSYTSIMGNIGASSAIISRVSRVISREDSVLRRLLEEKAEAGRTVQSRVFCFRKRNRVDPAGRHAKAAADAPSPVERRFSPKHGEGSHGTGLRALAATHAKTA